MTPKWIKPVAALLIVGLLAWFLPSTSFDPWNLLSPKKIATMLFALLFIQISGSFLNRQLGSRAGAILTGFFGGLVSSTATTAALARKSKDESPADSGKEMLTFLVATGAMLVEGFLLVWTGTSQMHSATLFIFSGPLLATVAMVYGYSKRTPASTTVSEEHGFEVVPLLKLAFFIISILILSKLLQNLFGQYGLMVLTFLVSLFEIHGSVIANVQLHESGVVATNQLSNLIAISIVASYLSKIFLISTLGSQQLLKNAMKATAVLFASLAATWLLSVSFMLS